MREHSVSNLMKRYSVDETHAALVVSVVNNIGPALLGAWTLDADEYLPLIRWAAQLHEIGKCVQYSGYHKHSAYLVSNSHSQDLTNTSKLWLQCSWFTVGKLMWTVSCRLLATWLLILRKCPLSCASACSCRPRSDRFRPHVDVQLDQGRIELFFPKDYLEARPLTRADLEQENVWLRQIGLSVKTDCRH